MKTMGPELPDGRRFVVPLLLAAAFVVVLFWLLHALISGSHGKVDKEDRLPTVDFVRLNKAFEVETRDRRPPPKAPDQPEAPPEAAAPMMQTVAPIAAAVNIGRMDVSNTLSVRSDIGLSTSDGEYLPIVKVSPIYPARAQSRGIEGWVLLEFTVDETGGVRDAVVIEAEPQGLFEQAALKAVAKFKYKPRVVNGRPVAVPKVQHLISFEIEK